MKKIAYFECPTGIAGDMCLGALINAGVPLDYLKEKLSLLGIDQEYQLHAANIQQNGQQATKAHIDLINSDHNHHNHHNHHHHHHDRKENGHTHSRYLPEIEFLIKSASLPTRAENWSLAIFRQLAQAEAAVHGIPPEKVHFHEVGATDAIVDIVGTCLGLDWLDIEKIYCSPLPTGGGTVKAAHGQLSVPVPAVLKLWEFREVPVYSNGIQKELCTPTGTAIAVTLADSFCPHPSMTVDRIGLGAGSAHLPIPNILRLWIGKEANNTDNFSSPNLETISVLETQIDDLSPQGIGYIFDSLFAVGALDVFTQAITMKKSRLGILLTVICHPENKNNCENVLFRETSTLGIRHSLQQRTILAREFQTIKTDFGAVRLKIAYKAGKIINVQPEYEDCAQIARENNLSWREVHRMVLQKWYGGNRSV